jgi:hypothetical protein
MTPARWTLYILTILVGALYEAGTIFALRGNKLMMGLMIGEDWAKFWAIVTLTIVACGLAAATAKHKVEVVGLSLMGMICSMLSVAPAPPAFNPSFTPVLFTLSIVAMVSAAFLASRPEPTTVPSR